MTTPVVSTSSELMRRLFDDAAKFAAMVYRLQTRPRTPK